MKNKTIFGVAAGLAAGAIMAIGGLLLAGAAVAAETYATSGKPLLLPISPTPSVRFVGLRPSSEKLALAKDEQAFVKAFATYNVEGSQEIPDAIWIADDTRVAGVDAAGRVTGLQPGRTTVRTAAELDGIRQETSIAIEVR